MNNGIDQLDAQTSMIHKVTRVCSWPLILITIMALATAACRVPVSSSNSSKHQEALRLLRWEDDQIEESMRAIDREYGQLFEEHNPPLITKREFNRISLGMDFRDVWPIIEDAPTAGEREGGRMDIDDWRVGDTHQFLWRNGVGSFAKVEVEVVREDGQRIVTALKAVGLK